MLERDASPPATHFQFPKEIMDWDGKVVPHDPTLIYLSLRDPMEKADLASAMKDIGLKFADANPPLPNIARLKRPVNWFWALLLRIWAMLLALLGIKPRLAKATPLPLGVPALNESRTGYFLESRAAGTPIRDSHLKVLSEELEQAFASFWPVYRHGREESREKFGNLFCLSPRTLLAKLKDGVDPGRLDEALKPERLRVDGNFKHPTLSYLRFDGGKEENVIELKARLAGKFADLIESVHFENMPVLNPQQGNLWNHKKISASPDKLAGIPSGLGTQEVPVAVIDRGIQFSNLVTGGIPKFSDSWNAGTFSVDNGFPVSEYHGTCCGGIISDASAQFAVVSNPGLHPILSIICPNFSSAQIAAAIIYAADRCPVISMSLSTSAWDPATIQPALDYAESRGCTICVSSGNSNYDRRTLQFPANAPNVISVGATLTNDTRAAMPAVDWYSNCGAELTITAPGTEIATTDLSGSVGMSPGSFTLGFSGTSAAAPHVAAVVAMIISKSRSLGFGSPSPAAVRSHLRSKSDKPSSGMPYDDVGHSETHGFGRLNAKRALSFTSPI